METARWIVQILLAVAFFMVGIAKTTQPVDRLELRMAWVTRFPPTTVRVIGLLEVLAAIGLILPAATGILPILTPLAAVGLILTLLGSILIHARAGETAMLGANFVLLALAAFVAYGRFVLVSFTT